MFTDGMIHYKTGTVLGFWPLVLGPPLFPILDSVEDQRPKTKGQSISDVGFGADLYVNRCSGIVRTQL